MPGGFDDEDEIGVGLKLQMLDGNRNAVGPGAEFRAVDAQHLAGVAVVIDHDQAAGNIAALFLRNEAELLAVDAEK